ncbi:MAG TPA: NAD-dependent epimerase/dehydratase family protein [Acidisphaera sp.]|nr:NAD-dependent epimerase/dehydratase family protein [Acidisphaera sp.]
MHVFITGASGYIGGTVAHRLLASGHSVAGLVRGEDKAAALRDRGIEPILGGLDDAALLTREARRADAVVNAADSDHRGAAEALVAALSGTGKPLLHTSGTTVVSDYARGEFSDRIYDEDSRPEPVPEKAARVAIDNLILHASQNGVRSAVICNSLIYGSGLGLHAESVQIPTLVADARRHGVARHVGRGLNVWSNVHVEDVADLYMLALDKAPPGSFFFAENGEASFRDITAAIAAALGLGAPQAWPVEDAIAQLGFQRAVFSLASNSRVRGRRSREVLGWTPRHASVTDWIRHDLAA